MKDDGLFPAAMPLLYTCAMFTTCMHSHKHLHTHMHTHVYSTCIIHAPICTRHTLTHIHCMHMHHLCTHMHIIHMCTHHHVPVYPHMCMLFIHVSQVHLLAFACILTYELFLALLSVYLLSRFLQLSEMFLSISPIPPYPPSSVEQNSHLLLRGLTLFSPEATHVCRLHKACPLAGFSYHKRLLGRVAPWSSHLALCWPAWSCPVRCTSGWLRR